MWIVCASVLAFVWVVGMGFCVYRAFGMYVIVCGVFWGECVCLYLCLCLSVSVHL